MDICIAGGDFTSSYVIDMFSNKKNHIVVINDNLNVCKHLAKNKNIKVIHSNPTKIYSFEDANVKGFDVIVALSESDSDNYVTCKIAKQFFGFEKAICLVKDPYNVTLFNELGIDSPVSSTYLLAESIKNESSIESMVKTLSLENNNLTLTEIYIKSDYKIANKKIKDIGFPSVGTIGCIYRKPSIVIPTGNVEVLPGDKLLVISAPKDVENIVSFVRTSKNGR